MLRLLHGEVIVEYCDLCNQAADQRFVKLCDGSRLALDEILQVPDLFHLFILDDAVHLGLSALPDAPRRLYHRQS